MNRTYLFLTVALASAASAATAASAQEGLPSAHAGRAATVEVRHTSLGNILVDSAGHTLYEFTRDHGEKDSCASVSGCLKVWPALQTSGSPTAGAGLKSSELSSINVPGVGRQVTYAGHPLYTYVGDTRAGETGYVGFSAFGGSWYALNASGQAVK